jgi:hypothetical protein
MPQVTHQVNGFSLLLHKRDMLTLVEEEPLPHARHGCTNTSLKPELVKHAVVVLAPQVGFDHEIQILLRYSARDQTIHVLDLYVNELLPGLDSSIEVEVKAPNHHNNKQ